MEGDLEGSIREMHEATHLAGIIPPAMIRENVISQQVRIDLALDQPALAENLLEHEGFGFGETFSFPNFAPDARIAYEAGLLHNSALRVLLYHARKKYDAPTLKCGIDLAERLLEGELRCQHLPIALETILLLSQMYAVSGDPHQSMVTAARALELAEPEDFISVFIEEGSPISDILTNLSTHSLIGKVQNEYVQKILSFFPAQTHPEIDSRKTATEDVQPANSVTMIEPLTPRELQVLRLIAEGDSNQTIAEKLVITVSAVKKHTGNIFGKLEVNSRTQAISRARQVGLLASNE